ncbi:MULTISPECIES: hypothetical protein [unclassified Yoonia]|uniref:hypothetical protein n=1 Tax=unclassified Yoonia TaxID=2629118 RepID=UPI002AFFFDCC|nr:MULTISPECIES: hypothetical protein [unclassified Yoonia]
MADPTDKAQTAARLRADLDAGERRDKPAYPDPATAPFGTDDEATETAVSTEQLRLARDKESHYDDSTDTYANVRADQDAVRVPGVDSAGPGAQPDPTIAPSRPSNVGLTVVAILALAALAVLIAVYP